MVAYNIMHSCPISALIIFTIHRHHQLRDSAIPPASQANSPLSSDLATSLLQRHPLRRSPQPSHVSLVIPTTRGSSFTSCLPILTFALVWFSNPTLRHPSYYRYNHLPIHLVLSHRMFRDGAPTTAPTCHGIGIHLIA